jgi:hypothetical protein
MLVVFDRYASCNAYSIFAFSYSITLDNSVSSLFRCREMPAPSAAQIQAAQAFVTEHVDADLAFLWSSTGVEVIHQQMIGLHYPTVKKFNVMADTRQEIRDICKSDYNLDPASGPEVRASVAAIVAAWESAKEFVSKDNQIRAEAKLSGQPRPVPSSERLAMRRAVELAFGELEDRECPSAEYLAGKLEEVEQNELTASSLDEVLSLDNSVNSTIQTAIDPSGSIKLVKTKAKGKLPANTEELRLKLKLEGNTWLFMAAKFRNRAWLAGLTPSCWVKYVEYLLGEKVLNLTVNRSDSVDHPTAVNPSWNILLSYELAMRKKVIKWAMEGKHSISNGLSLVTSDTELKELAFITPMLLGSRRRQDTSFDDSSNKYPRREKGRGDKGYYKGKGKGGGKFNSSKGKSKGKGKNPSGLQSRTPDGKLICYAYNNTGCKGSCGMVHVCRLCLLDHPMTQHGSKSSN